VVIIFAVVALAPKPAAQEENGNGAKNVSVLKIKKQDQVESTLVVKGTILPKQYTRIRSLVQGTVQFLQPVGERVAKGDSLFSLADSGIENNFFNAQDSFLEAQRNLTETEGLTLETLGQAALSVASAEASLSFTEQNLLVAQDNAEQSLQLAEEEARVAYSTAYNTMDQVMRYYGKGSIVDYILEDTPTASVQALDDAEIQFDVAKASFFATPAGAGTDIIFFLGELAQVLEQVKKLADKSFLALNFSQADDSTSFRQLLIDGYKAQTTTFISQLNAQASALNRAQNGVESAAILNRGALVTAENQLKLAQIQYDNSLSSLKSAQRSVDLQKLGSQQQITASQSQLIGASYQYNNLFLNSPFSGLVIAHRVNVGDQVSPGEVILEMGDINAVEIEVSVDNESAELLKIGDTVLIGEFLGGVIAEISPTADLTTGKVLVKIEADNSENLFNPGGVAEITLALVYEKPGSVVVPLSSVTVGQSETFVLLAKEGLAEKRRVTLGEVFDINVEVVNGLEEGDSVILQNGALLQAGDEIEVQSASSL
jgi:multidrug resistance efflux pump